MKSPLASALICLTLIAGGCSEEDTTSTAEKVINPITVFHTIVKVEQIVDPIMATGEVTADKRTDIKPRVDGIIEALYVDVGDQVQAGDALLKTRQIDYANRVVQLEHGVSLAKVELNQAERDLGRAESLRKNGVVSQGRMDMVVTQHQVAQSRLGIAQANLDKARVDLEDTIVRAPYDGIITARHIDEGTMIHVAFSGAPVLEITKLDIVEIVAQLPAVHLGKIEPGSRATVTLDGFAVPFETTLAVINDRVDARTRSAQVRMRIPNPDLRIKPGLFAKVTLYPAARPALTLARKAVLGLTGDNYIFVPDQGQAKRRVVEIRDLSADRIEVLAGVAAGETALTGPNLPNLRDGSPIQGKIQVHGAR
jgi:RND family efflux transporter MFP subunit